MPLMELRCKNCKGALTYDPESTTHRILNCPYCNTPYVETEEINYNQYNTQIEHLHADVVQVNNDQNAQARLRAGNANLSLKRFNNALEDFKEASKLAPDNYLAWWGQIQAISHDFTANLERKSELENLQKLFKYAMRMAPDRETQQLEEKFQSYINPLMNQNTRNITSATNELSELKGEQNRLEKELLVRKNKGYSKTKFPEGFFWLAAIILGICIFVISRGNGTPIHGFGAAISGIALAWIIIFRPISNMVAQSKEDENLRQIRALQQQLNNTNARIYELNQKSAHWTS